MASALVRAMTIDDAKIWKGGHRIILGATGTPPAVPTKIEDVINLTTFALTTGWTDFCATNEDGFTITREWDEDEGIPTDQRGYNLRAGSISNTVMGGSATSLYTDRTTLKEVWQLGTDTAIAAAMGTNVAQHRVQIGSPSTLTKRQVVVLQQNESTGKMRMFYFRKASFAEPGELGLSGGEVSTNEFNLKFEADTSITDGSDFGYLFEEDAA